MRIIAGKLKGRKLISPKGNDVRPTTDKVKEAVFDILYQYLSEGFVAFDVFAGSGNMGLEAVSRGASKVFFSDSSRESLSVVRQNVQICQAEDISVFLQGDYKRNIQRVKETVDLFILDPPYADGYLLPALNEISKADTLSKNGVIVCEHAYRDSMPEEYAGFTMVKSKKYGAIGVSIYMRSQND